MQAIDTSTYSKPVWVAICSILGMNLPDMSELSSLNNCMPPTRSAGKMAIAVTIMPMPPNHCNIARHSSRPRDWLSRFVKTVAPVVVSPEMLSNIASVIDMPIPRNGSAAKAGNATQTKTVSKKASRAPVRSGRKPVSTTRPVPNKSRIAALPAKISHSSRASAMSSVTQGSIAPPSKAVIMPRADVTVRKCMPTRLTEKHFQGI
ncbi:MAG: Uncharacterised protein [Hyphomonas sp. TMED17]|nr:MAG: Uncharacterised protein [Hyphomonas sp. TMED17]